MTDSLWKIAQDLTEELQTLRFEAPVTHVYNPLSYAAETHRIYLERFGHGAEEAVFLGMNPGPWGMAQTGVPFGEIELVRDWMGIEGPVDKPSQEHPKRPVEGFACTRSEVSGRRLWGWARDRFETPERFFQRFLVLNYCPLIFLEESGRNRTPDKLPVAERKPLFELCDRALRRSVELLQAPRLVGIGKFAERRAAAALKGLPVALGGMLHPSPASPRANAGWAQQAEEDLRAQGIELPEPGDPEK